MATAYKQLDERQYDETRYGPNCRNVVGLLCRLMNIDWFSELESPRGRREAEDLIRSWVRLFGIEPECAVVWVTREQLSSFIEKMQVAESPLWPELARIPASIRGQAEQAGRMAIIAQLAETVPGMLFHSAFDGAFQALAPCGMRVVQTAIGCVLYIGGLACAWEALADLEGWETNPFLPLVEVFAHGHWPLGWFGHQFYLI